MPINDYSASSLRWVLTRKIKRKAILNLVFLPLEDTTDIRQEVFFLKLKPSPFQTSLLPLLYEEDSAAFESCSAEEMILLISELQLIFKMQLLFPSSAHTRATFEAWSPLPFLPYLAFQPF
ncbi:hypothetical protein RJT34_13004 [Clitoria ternatea]|uniref:Uncharacterized protein n=1 Tax=Clitoria ternatea TaxID=43366 RepID=A0AAN9JRB5_CLITE